MCPPKCDLSPRRFKMCPNDAHCMYIEESVMGLGDKISLFLKDWELAKSVGIELSHGHGHAYAQEMNGARECARECCVRGLLSLLEMRVSHRVCGL